MQFNYIPLRYRGEYIARRVDRKQLIKSLQALNDNIIDLVIATDNKKALYLQDSKMVINQTTKE